MGKMFEIGDPGLPAKRYIPRNISSVSLVSRPESQQHRRLSTISQLPHNSTFTADQSRRPSPRCGLPRNVSTISLPCRQDRQRQVSQESAYQHNRRRHVSQDGQKMVVQLVLPKPESAPPTGLMRRHASSTYLSDSRQTSPDVYTEGYCNPAFSNTGESNSSICNGSERNLQGVAADDSPPGSAYCIAGPGLPPGVDCVSVHSARVQPYAMDNISVRSFASNISRTAPPPTPKEEKRKMFRGYLTKILSCVYAIFILMLGVVIYVADLVQPRADMAEVFSIYLTFLGLCWLTFLYVDIRRYLNKLKTQSLESSAFEDSGMESQVEMETTPEGGCQITIPVPRQQQKPLLQHYCFSTGRHSGSFYLKIGAAGFCFGHLVHHCLLLGRQVIYFTTTDHALYRDCANVATLTLDVISPVYSFFQLYILFKYSNVIINRSKELARFAFMHCIATSLCFWFWTILRETVDSLQEKMASKHHGTTTEEPETLGSITPLPLTAYNDMGAKGVLEQFNTSLGFDACSGSTILSQLILQFAPYLYPFSIEYSILVVGVWFIIWQNIGRVEEQPSASLLPSWPELKQDFASNLVVHADCHSANKGLFAGLLVLVATVVSVIVFFIAFANKNYVEVGLIVNVASEIALLVLMTVAVLFAYRQMTKLDVNQHPISLLDDLLLFICLPSFFLYGIFSIVPAMAHKNYVSILASILQVVQVILQTPFIIDGLRRCSNTGSLRYDKPGRELVTFLVVCNLAVWIIETFEIKSAEAHDDKKAFYGSLLWTLLSHMTQPLTLFYRFHSSVCLVDMWKSAYEPGE